MLMPEEQTEKKDVKLQQVRSSLVESMKMSCISEFGSDTALKSSKIEESKIKIREESKAKK